MPLWITRKSARGLAAAALFPILVTGFGAGSAAAATAGSAAPALVIISSTNIGTAAGIGSETFAESPNGIVYYSQGSAVNHVCPPQRAIRPDRCFRRGRMPVTIPRAASSKQPILALAATTTALFTQVGLTVTEYSEPSGAVVRHWTLTSPVKPVTSAGLLIVGSTLWSWTDWATDRSGFEYARVSRIVTSSAAVHVVSDSAYPRDMAADPAGLYFEVTRRSAGYLAHATPSGTVTYRKQPAVDAPLALSGGHVNVLEAGSSGVSVDVFSATSLRLISSKRVSADDRSIAASTLGLLVLAQPCSSVSCSGATVSLLNASTGKATGTLVVPHAYLLLAGPLAEVIQVSGKKLVLLRLGG